MILSIIGIVLGVIAIGLFTWLRREQEMNEGLNTAETQHTHQGMNAMMDDFNNYQVETDRKSAELEKRIMRDKQDQDRRMEKHIKELPFVIGKVVGQIEFSQDIINKK